jgi:arylsulfatase A-like enzyme
MRPNVICIVLDTARADALEPYGAPMGTSPTVAQLASRGVALPNAYATASWTLPSHASMFTGLPYRAIGVAKARASRPENRALLEAQSERMLPAVMKRAGYTTGAVSTNLWISEKTGFGPGFDRFFSVGPGRQKRLGERTRRARIRWIAEAVRAEHDDGAAEAESALGGWIDSADRAKPFFWFVNLVECHSPYLPPRPYNDLSAVARARAGDEARRHLTLRAIWRACVGEFDVPDAALERMRHLYLRSVRYMDDWLARLLQRLETGGLLDDTIVLVTSDHGENFGEGGLLAHSFSLDDRLIRVPLVVGGPATLPDPTRVWSLVELPRLVAELTGIDDHPWGAGEHGRDVAVAQLDPPVRADDPVAEDIADRWHLDDAGRERLTSAFTCATDGGLKLFRHDAGETYVDLDEDPLELAPQPVRTAPSTLTDRIARLREALDQPTVRATPELDEAGLDGVPTESEREQRELEERMRVLGYL